LSSCQIKNKNKKKKINKKRKNLGQYKELAEVNPHIAFDLVDFCFDSLLVKLFKVCLQCISC